MFMYLLIFSNRFLVRVTVMTDDTCVNEMKKLFYVLVLNYLTTTIIHTTKKAWFPTLSSNLVFINRSQLTKV